MFKKFSEELLLFIEKSKSCFHSIENIKHELDEHGFEELLESKKWNLEKGKKYYVTRNSSSIIAFDIGEDLDNYSFNMVASHSDSPTFKIKDNYKIEVSNKYIQLNTEKYGGMLCSTWFDRPLSVAGRVIVKKGNKLVTKLVDVDRDLVLIPNVAIHMNRTANTGMKYNEQIDMLPLFGSKNDDNDNFMDIVADSIGVKKDDIVGNDLFLYNRMKPSIWGSNNEYISSPKLDDLQCAFTSLRSFISAHNDKSINVYCCFDNEEVGSATKQGAQSTFLVDSLKRINEGIGKNNEDYFRALASSFMLSADNAHAVHPNHPEKSDPTNRVYMNDGIVIKYNANQKYTTDAVSSALFKTICKNIDVPCQSYTNRSDMPGGSTLGNIATTHVSIRMVDIGLAQLAMHSSYETAGMKDTYYMFKAIKEFYNSHIEETSEGTLEVSI